MHDPAARSVRAAPAQRRGAFVSCLWQDAQACCATGGCGASVVAERRQTPRHPHHVLSRIDRRRECVSVCALLPLTAGRCQVCALLQLSAGGVRAGRLLGPSVGALHDDLRALILRTARMSRPTCSLPLFIFS
eukprot:132855-Rhodomonas_salina.1